MRNGTQTLGISISIILIGLLSTVAYATSKQPEFSKSEHIEIFRQGFEPSNWRQKSFFLRSQTWGGVKSFCVISEGDTPFSRYVETSISDIAHAYNKAYTVSHVTRADKCSKDRHSVIILLSQNPGFAGFQKLFQTLIDDYPSEDYADFGSQIAFTLPLHNLIKGTFIFVDATFGHSHPEPNIRNSIWLEELLQGLSGGRDIATDQIISMLGENHNVDAYAGWYRKNARAFCQVDFMILELVLNGGKYLNGRSFKTYLNYFENQYEKLNEVANKRRESLGHIADRRC